MSTAIAPDSSGSLEAANVPAAASCYEATPPGKKKMFFTTSDLIERMNLAINDANDDILISSASKSLRDTKGMGGNTEGFELQMKLPDGSYRRAEQKEIAAADFQTKMKQASERIVGFDSEQKIKWAKCQRLEGNALFAKGEYVEAMDVYLTCLVAMDQPFTNVRTSTSDTAISALNKSDDPSESRLLQVQMEREIKLPVLLNLALCSLKMGMLSKAEQFCNFAMETELGKQSPKASFFRGRARLLMGKYGAAESDLNNALNILKAKQRLSDEKIENNDLKEGEDEEAVILREKLKLQKIVHRAKKNMSQQKKAMEKMFLLDQTACFKNETDREIAQTTPSLYPEKIYRPNTASLLECTSDAGTDTKVDCQPTYVQWYLRMMGRCAQKILDVIGGDEEKETIVDVPVDQNLLNILMGCKKIA